MFLKDTDNGHLVEVLELTELLNPLRRDIHGRYHFGEEAQDPEPFQKNKLAFPSGEPLPRCWTDPHHRDQEMPVRPVVGLFR